MKILYFAFQCNYDHTIPDLEAILSSGDNNFSIPYNTCNQHIFLSFQALQWYSHIGGLFFYNKFQCLNTIIYKMVHCLNIGTAD